MIPANVPLPENCGSIKIQMRGVMPGDCLVAAHDYFSLCLDGVFKQNKQTNKNYVPPSVHLKCFHSVKKYHFLFSSFWLFVG